LWSSKDFPCSERLDCYVLCSCHDNFQKGEDTLGTFLDSDNLPENWRHEVKMGGQASKGVCCMDAVKENQSLFKEQRGII
jgi:hypothetical protein